MMEEYKDLSNNIRTNANLRFAQLTIFVALTSGLVTSYTGAITHYSKSTVNISSFPADMYAVIGILITVAFWIMDERTRDYMEVFRKRARDLEQTLEYRQYSIAEPALLANTRLGRRYRSHPYVWRALKNHMTGTNAMRGIFVGTFLLWTYAYCYPAIAILLLLLVSSPILRIKRGIRMRKLKRIRKIGSF